MENQTTRKITLNENGMHIRFRVNEDGTVELTDFSAAPSTEELRPIPPFIFGYRDVHGAVSVQIDGESINGLNAYKHNAGSENGKFLYRSHEIEPCADGKLLILSMETKGGSERERNERNRASEPPRFNHPQWFEPPAVLPSDGSP